MASSSRYSASPPSTPTNSVLAASKTSWRFYAAFACLCLVNFVCALDATSLSVALPMVAEKLNGTAIQAFWSGTSFLLASTVFQPVYAMFSNIFGRKPLLLLSLTFFTVGAIVCGVSTKFNILLIGRSIQGVGGGGLVALTYVIVTDLIPMRQRGKWYGVIAMQWAVGSVTGPVIGGAFAERASWRWIFWINLPFCGLAFVMIPLFLRLAFIPSSLLAKLRRVDWTGSAIFVASLTGFLVPLTWGGIMYPWDHWRTLVPLLLSAAGLLAFVAYEMIVPNEPLIRGTIFKTKTASVSYLGTVLHGTILWSLLYYLPLYYQVAQSQSAIVSGISLFPQTFTVAPASIVTGILIARTGDYRIAIWTGWTLSTLGLGLLVLLDESMKTVVWIFINLVSGLGLGILYPSTEFAVQAAVDDKDLPLAVAMFSFFRSFGQAIGVAVGGVVFQNRFEYALRSTVSTAALPSDVIERYSHDASALVEVIKSIPANQLPLKTGLVESYVSALRTVWIVMCALSALSLVLSLGTRKLSLDRELVTDQGFLGGGLSGVKLPGGGGGSSGTVSTDVETGARTPSDNEKTGREAGDQ
ncbi:MAG: hypothetical protein M1817_001030 [Caeruleum heppii]|nr:MAG: hypothetical protein M1817_001030 [Caeruleum heppii]